MQLISDYPMGWKLMAGTVGGLAILVAGYLKIDVSVIGLAASVFGAGIVTKMATDKEKIKATGNGDFDTTGKPKNGGDAG